MPQQTQPLDTFTLANALRTAVAHETRPADSLREMHVDPAFIAADHVKAPIAGGTYFDVYHTDETGVTTAYRVAVEPIHTPTPTVEAQHAAWVAHRAEITRNNR